PTLSRNLTATRYVSARVTLLLSCFTATATAEIYTLSLHDALPISDRARPPNGFEHRRGQKPRGEFPASLCPENPQSHFAFRMGQDRKSTRLNSSHLVISYAVFCLKKKNRCRPSRRRPGPAYRRCLTLLPQRRTYCQ